MNTAAKVSIFFVELLIWLLSIALGSYLGGVSIGFAGALTVGILCYGFQEPVGAIPWDVLQIILSVVCLSAAVQAAGGMDYLVKMAERILRSQPKYVTFLAPAVVWVLTIVCGTGYIFFAVLPVVAEVAKSVGIRPARPLTTASLAAMFAVVASPLSSAMVIISDSSESYGRKFSYLQLVAIMMPSTLVALLLTSCFVCRMGPDLWDDEEFLRRYRSGLVKGIGGRPADFKFASDIELDGDSSTRIAASVEESQDEAELTNDEPLRAATTYNSPPSQRVEDPSRSISSPTAKSPSELTQNDLLIRGEKGRATEMRHGARISVLIFSIGMLGAMTYAIIYSRLNGTRDMPTDIGQGIVIFTLTTSLVISLVCRVTADEIIEAPLFKSGITAAISVLGIAWAGSTLVESHLAQMTDIASDWVRSQSWIIALVCFFMSSLMMSQAAAARVFIPTAFAMGVSPFECLIAYSCCASVYLLPASPAIVSAVSLDDCGTTSPGKYVFDHTMMVPGLINTLFTTGFVALLGYAIGGSDSLEQ